ncbi:MAG: hypothetical protein M3542_13715 [Acidobacteriota bacterium]|nr:hypothetical protein [Acidobacteriota bacterium]
MHTCLSPEAKAELRLFKDLDRDVGIALEACIEMLALDPNEVDLLDGFSIKRVVELHRRRIRVSRVKYENHFHGVRILFFPIASKDCVFVTGIHGRGDLGFGNNYDFFREPFVRAQRYWGLRESLCTTS